jgi:colanic acid/amylovoran biosynthesis glycosyltransferase
MTPRSVAYVVNMFPKVSETFIASEIAGLVQRGLTVRLLSLKAPSETLRHPIVEALGLERLAWYDLAAFRQALLADPPDLVHAHFATEPTRVGQALADELGRPFAFTAHAYDFYRKPAADLPARLQKADAVVTVSEANADFLVAQFGATRTRLHVLPCGVDLGAFQPRPHRREPGLVVCVARLRPHKNVPLLLAACARLRDRGLAFRVVVIGEGPSRHELEVERDRLGLTAAVTFVGALGQDAVCDWWQRASVAVLPSRSEGMPVSLMEAAACGVPAVATAVGGVAELIEDGETGVVTPSDDVTALAEGLARILTSEPTRLRMSAAARLRAEARFGLTRQVDALLGIWGAMRPGVAA